MFIITAVPTSQQLPTPGICVSSLCADRPYSTHFQAGEAAPACPTGFVAEGERVREPRSSGVRFRTPHRLTLHTESSLTYDPRKGRWSESKAVAGNVSSSPGERNGCEGQQYTLPCPGHDKFHVDFAWCVGRVPCGTPTSKAVPAAEKVLAERVKK